MKNNFKKIIFFICFFELIYISSSTLTCPVNCNHNSCSHVTGCCTDGCVNGFFGNCTCSISQSCASPTGVTCDFYSQCLYTKTTPTCPFIINTMQNKCQEYKDIELTYSALGIQWSRNVRSCLQKVLANKILVPAPSGIVNCEVVTKAFFNEHLDCYLKGPISYCSLPFTDKWKIIEHGTGILFSSHWYETLSTAAKLLKNCGMRK